MLSMAAIASGPGAADYYAGDNYYTGGQLTEESLWFGQAAEMLGLSGNVDASAFESVLAGHLPDGAIIPDGTRGEHRPGVDMTFSAPKSISLLAYVGGDERLLTAHRSAVKSALAWTEEVFAEAKVSKGHGQEVVGTGNLLIALFQHDTSRALDPQAHVHAVIANATKAKDGNWRALAEIALWRGKTTIASVYNAEFRQQVEALGYRTQLTGKHGQFEIQGIDRKVIDAFSQRRAEIEKEATKLEHNTPAAMAAVTLRTRGDKPADVDRAVLHAEWQGRAKVLGFNPKALVADAIMRAAREPTPWARVVEGILGAVAQAQMLAQRLRLVAPGAVPDPLVPERPGRLSPDQFATAHAVASAVRHLSEREAGFRQVDLVKAALDLGPPVGVAAVESRIASLVGKGQAAPLLARGITRDDLAAEARRNGLKLTTGQAEAALTILGSSDRVVHVQGNAGTGKSAMLTPVARLVEADGYKVIGLAVSNAITNRIKAEVGIEARTVASFIRTHRALLSPSATAEQRQIARAALNGALIVVDEASMLSTRDAAQLVAIANAAGAGRLVLIGDTKQLGAVEAGKPFALGQDAATAVMDQNLRARTPEMLALHKATQVQDIHTLATLIKPHTIEAPSKAAETAARMWIDLSPGDRARTAIFVSGRVLRAAVNAEVQRLRKDAGELGPSARISGTLIPVHLTREEQKLAVSYRAGQIIELSRPLAAQGLPKGLMEVQKIRSKGEIEVRFADGRSALFRSDRLAGNRVEDAIRVFDQRDIQLHVGDPVRWTANDPARGLVNTGQAMLESREPDALIFRDADNNLVRLERDDPMLKRIDLAYATNAHASQGPTADRAIIVAQSTEGALINRQLVGVLFTRAREEVQLVVDSLPSFERRAQINSGAKTAAVEVAEAQMLPEPKAAEPDAHDLQRHLPEKELEIDSKVGVGPTIERERDMDMGL